MDLVFDVLTWLFLMTGLFFMLVGTVGVLRMPDVFTRLHAAGMTDTMGAGFLLLGMGVHTVLGIIDGEMGSWAVLVRLVLVYAFLTFTSPISTHALARAAIAGGVEPWMSKEGDDE